MRFIRFLVVVLIAAAQAGCAGMLFPELAAAPAAAAPADLDGIDVRSRTRAGPPVLVPAVPAHCRFPRRFCPDLRRAVNEPYTLDTGDRLRVVVFGQDGLSNTYIVDASGKITMPLIGAVSARGCTTTQLARVIADRLRNGYVREPHVAIEVETYRPFFILGEVLAPGQYPYVPNMTVETAVAIAGGFTPRAYRYDFEVSRSSMGVTSRQKVPLIAPVRPGDTVTVSERWF